MSGFETIVRPVVFPNIRPLPARVLTPPDDPTQGMATIKGGSPTSLSGSLSSSYSLSRQLPAYESKRVYDKERVYQKDNNGKINKDNFVDVERMKKLRVESQGQAERFIYADPPKVDNVETLEADVVRDA